LLLWIPYPVFFHPGSRSRIQGSKIHDIQDPGSGSATLMLGIGRVPVPIYKIISGTVFRLRFVPGITL